MQQQQPNQSTQNQQGVMSQPPAVVSSKDALYLTDMLSWNLLAAKKAHFYAQNCQDQQLKNEIDKCGRMHQQHYQQILSHLNRQNQAFSGMQ